MAAAKTRPAAIPRILEPMEAQLVGELPRNAGWQYEPKWDGFRCLAIRDGARVELQARSMAWSPSASVDLICPASGQC